MCECLKDVGLESPQGVFHVCILAYSNIIMAIDDSHPAESRGCTRPWSGSSRRERPRSAARVAKPGKDRRSDRFAESAKSARLVQRRGLRGGRWRTRTSDLVRVKHAL